MRVTSVCCLLFVVLFGVWTLPSEGARILAVWPIESHSHFTLGSRILKELAARGHEVTMINPYPQKKPLKNFRDIAVTGLFDELMSSFPKDQEMDFIGFSKLPIWQQMLITNYLGSTASKLFMEREAVQKFLQDKNEKFDLVIFEMFYTELLYGFAHHFNCPVVVLSSIESTVMTNHLVGNPAPSSYVPDLFTHFPSHMTLYERFYNTLFNFFTEMFNKYYYIPAQDKLLHKYFPDAPSLEELMYNKTAMVLLNSHPSISEPKPHVPAMVEIGGFHVESPQPLPKDLQDFMDSAKEGVILFSLGSNLKTNQLPEKKRNNILQAFSKLKQKVIWKWEDENLPGKPNNVKLMKWCPQKDILAHPNLKAFITHGGLLSTTEAVYYGVPVIGIPFYGDQQMNVAMTVRKGFGIGLNYEELNEETLTNALNEILTNPKYRENAKKASSILQDQPVKPLDLAIFWINHVLKNKGADHFRTAAMDLQWYQLYSVDLIAIFVFVNVAIIYTFYHICKKLCAKKVKKD